jgi:diacylglycerol kinase family enzyme
LTGTIFYEPINRPASPGLRKEEPRIKVTLIHNPSAGDDSKATGEQIVRLISAAGHKVNYQSSKEKKWRKALKKSCDVVAVAGGDGTVAKVAKQLIDSRTPIAVLPTGTANNIAKTLGTAGSPLQELIKGWPAARCVNFDAGVAQGPWGSECFIEGFGIGLFAEAMMQLDGKENVELADSGKPKEVIQSVLSILKKQLRGYQAKKMTVRLDGEEHSGDYVVLEALNIRHIGPNLNLAPRADINDGLLDVVLVSKRQRAALGTHLAALVKRKQARPNLTIRRCQHLQIKWENSPVHIDDMPWPGEDEDISGRWNTIDLRMRPAALVFLIPKVTRRAR